MEQLLILYGDKAKRTPAFEYLYTSNDFWKQYYEINFSSSTVPVMKDCANDQGEIDYFAACNLMSRLLYTDSTNLVAPLITALKAGADQYIIKYNIKPANSSSIYVEAAILSGNPNCMKFFDYYQYSIQDLRLAGDSGGVEMYELIHEQLLKKTLLARKYDTVSHIFDVCAVRDDIATFQQKINLAYPEFYQTAIRSDAMRIMRKLLRYPLATHQEDFRPDLFEYAILHNASLEMLTLLSPYNKMRPLDINLSYCPLSLLEFLHDDSRIDPEIDYNLLFDNLETKRRGFTPREGQTGPAEELLPRRGSDNLVMISRINAKHLSDSELKAAPSSYELPRTYSGSHILRTRAPMSAPERSRRSSGNDWASGSSPLAYISTPIPRLTMPNMSPRIRSYSPGSTPRLTPRPPSGLSLEAELEMSSPRSIQASFLTINIIGWLMTRYPPAHPEIYLQRLIDRNLPEDFAVIHRALNSEEITDKLTMSGSFAVALSKCLR